MCEYKTVSSCVIYVFALSHGYGLYLLYVVLWPVHRRCVVVCYYNKFSVSGISFTPYFMPVILSSSMIVTIFI